MTLISASNLRSIRFLVSSAAAASPSAEILLSQSQSIEVVGGPEAGDGLGPEADDEASVSPAAELLSFVTADSWLEISKQR